VDYRFLEVNPGFEKLTGMRATDLIGRTVKQVIPEVEPYWIDFYGQVALRGVPAHTEQYSQVFNRYYTVTAYSPRAGQFAAIFSDASERHRAEEAMKKAFNEAESANRAKTQFLANMSHELRTPLNAIIGLSELLQDSPLLEDQLDYVKTINTSGEALLSIIADLLDLSKIELGRIELRHAPFSIRAAVDHVFSVLKPFAQQKNLDLSVRVSDAVPDRITGDTDRLQQVLINIINNALKFTQQGYVRLSVDALQTPGGARQVVFEVEDSGIGMDKETMMRIFEPFQQGDASITREHGGTGLGLSICRSLVNLMGGTIHVASDKGHGSIFRFYITDSSGAEDLSVNETLLAACRGKTVCLWDDDPENLHALEYLLGQYGIRVFFGAGIKEVPLCLQETPPPDAVFCNLDIDGMRENLPVLLEGKQQIPLIAVSRWIVPLTDSMKPAFDGFLDKPVRPAQVTELLTRLFL
jgi:PAS domain S-box-containing protein